MPITRQDLAKLADLQEQDRRIDVLAAALALVPQDIAALRGELDSEKGRLAAHKDKATQTQLRKKEKELELAKQEELIRKHTSDLNQVKTNEAFKALQGEIDRAKVQAGELETQILVIMEEADALVQDEKKLKADFARAEADVNSRVGVLEARKSEQEAQLAAEKSRRESMTQGIAAEVISLYEQTRKRRKGIGLSKLKGNVCEACHMTLPPQVVINVAKGTTLITCDSCQRILFSTDPAPGAPKGASAPAA
ncbi:MAG TPA: C4-type zinc ribbon domain-containing protein [Elusimicrobiota bacterium]|jgi:predicted  nucleic acid-binding Zn-ribbon protein|nr:C4-type zinc ribbon domain-containing protein [Elusimicrobiota bacterium]